jgi:hypothetical protein
MRKSLGERIAGTNRKPEVRDSGYDLGQADLENFTMPFASRVTIKLNDGSTLTHLQIIPIGGPGRPEQETREQVKNKFMSQAAANLGPEQAQRFIELLESQETGKPAADILKGCSKPL